jgi:hypothetical protein
MRYASAKSSGGRRFNARVLAQIPDILASS